MRSLHKLYQIIFDEMTEQILTYGICYSIITSESLSQEEQGFLMKHFIENKPSIKQHQQFYHCALFTNNTYWWDMNDPQSKQQRLNFISYMIEITTPIPLYKRIIKFFIS